MKSQSGIYNNKNVLDFEYVTIIVCCSNSKKLEELRGRKAVTVMSQTFYPFYLSIGVWNEINVFNVIVLLRQAFGDHLTDQLLKLQAIR